MLMHFTGNTVGLKVKKKRGENPVEQAYVQVSRLRSASGRPMLRLLFFFFYIYIDVIGHYTRV